MPTYEAIVREVVPEAPETVTIRLDCRAPVTYRAGQFLTIDPFTVAEVAGKALELQDRKGRKERPRAYSLASAPHEEFVAITVKEDPPGAYPALLSPWLVRGLKEGDAVSVAGFNGLYTLPDELPADAHVVHVCAGSGIVPNFAMLKDALHRGLPAKQTLLFSNRRWLDVIYGEELARLALAHPGKLRVVHALTRDPFAPPDVEVRGERIGSALIRECVPELEKAWFFVCGPSVSQHERAEARARGEKPQPKFLESVRAFLLEELGVAKARVFTEGW
jgi:ferredoxin-NADP reductase